MLVYKVICIFAFIGFTFSNKLSSTGFYDLSYSISEETIFFPGTREYELSKDYEGFRDNTTNSWYSAYSFCMGEHGGTHLDAPFHFYREGWTVDKIPDINLIDVPGVIIDVSEKLKGAENPNDYTVTVEDIMEFEHGGIGTSISSRNRIRHGYIVLFYTGWSKYWPNRKKYLGIMEEEGRESDEKPKLSFPGISEDAAKWLYNERSIVGIGIDTPSVDPGNSSIYPVHRFLAKKQVYNLENVANLHQLLQTPNCQLFVLPLKIIGGTGAPVRILASCS